MKRWPLNKAYFWETAPFFRLLLPLAAGILCYEQGWIPHGWGYGLAVAACLLFAGYGGIIYSRKTTGLLRIASFTLAQAALLCTGISLSYFNDIRNNPSWFGNNIISTSLGRITDVPAEKEHTWKIPVHITNTISNGHVLPATGNAFVYLYKDGTPTLLHEGDSILLPGKWELIKNAGNPYEFDYAAYCLQNNIIYQQTCSARDVRLYGAAMASGASVTDRAHDWCMTQLATYIQDPKTKGLIQAMLLGDEVNLDEDLRQSYADTGIIHIIAISGGNIAIFFLVISWLLWWLKDKRHLWVKYSIALPLVWFYVVMAGAPPSAVRAAIMFSLLAFAVLLQKNNNSLNQLLATAFLLLCVQPMWLFSAGFQLSFTAVLSLILFYKPVYQWVAPVYKISKLLWGTVAASIAAELLVAPLVIYYFHTFPLLFVIANAVAYLFMGLVLILGIAIIVLSFIPFVAKALGIVTVWIVTVFDKIVDRLQSFSPQSFHFLTISGIELLLVYVVIIRLTLFLLKKQTTALIAGLTCACVLLAGFCGDEWTRLHQHRFAVYNTGKANNIEVINGTTYTVLSADTTNREKTIRAVTPAHIAWQAWQKDSTAKNEVLTTGGKTILILNKPIATYARFPVDYLVINYTGAIDPLELQHTYSPGLVIIGNNYTKEQQDKLVKTFTEAHIAIYSIADKGAFVL